MIAKGNKVSEEGGSFSRYKGVGICRVLAVNPNKAELEKLYGRSLDKDPVYVGKRELDNGKTVDNVRISFICEVTSIMLKEPVIMPVTFFVANTYRYNASHDKVQIIDAYGRTAWATKADIKNHSIPVYKNDKPANISENYRLALDGEQELTEFLQALINIPNVQKYNKDTSEWKMVEHPEDSECRLDSIKEYFSGDVSELKDIITYQPENQVRVMFGIKTDSEGRQQQVTYNKKFLRLYQKDYTKLKEEIEATKAQGYLANIEYFYGNLKEDTVTPTDLSSPVEASSPSVDDDLPEDTMPASPAPAAASAEDDGDDLPFDL